MATSIHEHELAAAAGDPAVGGAGSGAAGRADRLTGIALMTGSAAANQVGAATAALAFPVLGPAGWSRSASG